MIGEKNKSALSIKKYWCISIENKLKNQILFFLKKTQKTIAFPLGFRIRMSFIFLYYYELGKMTKKMLAVAAFAAVAVLAGCGTYTEEVLTGDVVTGDVVVEEVVETLTGDVVVEEVTTGDVVVDVVTGDVVAEEVTTGDVVVETLE